MQDEENKVKNNTGTIVAIVSITVIFLIAIGSYAWYSYTSEEDDNATLDGICSDEECDLDTQTSMTSANLQTTNNKTSDTYTNSRYGFTVSDIGGFTSFESDNGDGITYTSANNDATTIMAYGSNNAESLDLSSYLDREGKWLQENAGDAQEIATNEVEMDGCIGERRSWEYIALDGNRTTEEKAACLKDNVFYTIDLVVLSDNYSKYSNVFDDEIFSFRFK